MKATTTPVSDERPCEYDRSRTYGWNGENRLISAENGDTRLEFSYDYMGRRFEKKVYTANVLTKHEKCGWPRKLDNLTWCKMPIKLT